MDDVELLEVIKTSKNDGTMILFDKYHRLVEFIVRAKLDNIASDMDVDECVNSVFFEFINCVHKIDSEKGIKSYLCAIARNRSISKYRTLISYNETLSIDDELVVNKADHRRSLDDELIEADDRKALVQEIVSLGYPDRDIIVYKYYFCLSTKVIAEKLSMSVSAVDVRCHRALKKLKKRLGGNK